MSLFGAMFSGVSGLNAQSQAMGIISDNISNLGTVGYKASEARFSTLVTQSATNDSYSPGGVRMTPFAMIDKQGLLEASDSATDIAVAGTGFLVVNTQDNSTGQFLFTRAGSFTVDLNGNLVNTGGYYLQGWPTDPAGVPTAANTSIVSTLSTVNVSGVSGVAVATTQVGLGANLPASSPIGSNFDNNLLIFDSLGVAHNLQITWTKTAVNTWDVAINHPVLANDASNPTGSFLIARDSASNALSAQGRFDFTAQPADGNTVTIDGVTYEFDNNATTVPGNVAVAIGGTLPTTLANLVTAVGDPRVTSDGISTVSFNQVFTDADANMTISAAGTPAIAQSSVAPFILPPIAESGFGRIFFTGQPADGETVVIDGVTFEFDNNATTVPGNTAVAIGGSTAASVANLAAAAGDPRITASGGTLLLTQSGPGAALAVNAAGVANTDPDRRTITVPAFGSLTPDLVFNGNGTPASINVASLEVSGWTTGASNSTVALNFGSVGSASGMTQFSGDFTTSFVQQNGVQFGIFTGVLIDEDGLVTATFDNGETRPIYKIPLATFANASKLEARTGNAYGATDQSGQILLNFADGLDSSRVAAGALESSNVDLGSEFTKMVITQQAFSASSRIITTADEMLDELVRIIR